MSFVLSRRLLAGLLLGAAGWAAPALAQTAQVGAPTPEALASATHFTELCTTKLKLAPAQASSLHAYLDQEVNYLNVLALNGLAAQTPDLTITEAEQLDEVMAKLLSPAQLHDFGKLQQTPQAQADLRHMALLPDAASLANSKRRQRHTSEMVAQRLDEVE